MRKIAIAGLGSIGSQLMTNLYFNLSPVEYEFEGYDFDIVEKKNFVNQIYPSNSWGLEKAQVMESAFYTLSGKWPDNVKCKVKKIEEPIVFPHVDLVVDCFDNFESRNYLIKSSPNVVHLGFSPEQVASVLWDEKYKEQQDNDSEDVCDTASMRYWLLGVTGIMTGNILGFLETGEKRSLIIDKNFNQAVL